MRVAEGSDGVDHRPVDVEAMTDPRREVVRDPSRDPGVIDGEAPEREHGCGAGNGTNQQPAACSSSPRTDGTPSRFHHGPP